MSKKRRQMQRDRGFQLSQEQLQNVSEHAKEEFENGRPLRHAPKWALMSLKAYEAFAYALHDEVEKLEKQALPSLLFQRRGSLIR